MVSRQGLWERGANLAQRFHLAPALLLLALGVLHFHDGKNFTRPLLDFDDVELIGPLDGMSLSTYFGEWAAQSDHFLFPLRDLTYAVDFKLSHWLNVQTFWLVNFAIFVLTLLVIGRTFAIYYRGRPMLVAGFVALIALHPINVHMVEWLSNRKHLLVLLILGWATCKALKQVVDHVEPSTRDWATYFGAYVAAWLCYPTGALWIFWLLLVFLPQLRRGRAVVLWALALVIAGSGYYLTVAANASFQGKAGLESSPVLFSLASTGRALFNLLFPLELQPYYRMGGARAWVGLGLLVVGSALLCHRLLKASRAQLRAFFHILSLALALYLPNAKVFLGYAEFVWSDRYLYGALPFLVLAVLILLIEPYQAASPVSFPKQPWQRLSPGLIIAVSMAVGATYLVLDWQLVPRWQDSRQLFETCSHEERAPKCVAMAIEKNFDHGGCALLPELFDLARQLAPHNSKAADHSFQAETPVYEALCIASSIASTEEKLRGIQELFSSYPMTDFLMLGQILIRLQARDLTSALATAQATYFDPNVPMPNTTTKIVNMMRGQGEALCVLSELVKHDKSCWNALEIFRARVGNTVVKPKQTSWTFQRTLSAYNTGN